MKPARAKEVLYDSEAVLRLVDRELQELREDMTSARLPRTAETPVTDAAPAEAASRVDPATHAPPRPR